MSHAFAGVTVFFINKEWKLEEHVLDIHALEGDHTGAAVGKKIFRGLKDRKLLELFSKFSATRPYIGFH